MKYLYTLIFIFFLCQTNLSANNAIIEMVDNVCDTIPNDGYLYDTITVFDKDTYKERTVIYRTKIEGYRYDTLIVFDPETMEESFQITKVAYGSEKEIVKPESDEDKERKLLECYEVKWGPIKHNYVFGSPNRVYVNPKMVDEILESDIKVIQGEDCEVVNAILSLNIMVQYDNGSNTAVVQGQSADSHGKLKKNKRKSKEGTIYTLNKLVIEIGERTLELPYVQFVVKK